ncbi:MAG TPA: rhodanese-like domain-containing protein [Thermoanaerobaculia bacterium]
MTTRTPNAPKPQSLKALLVLVLFGLFPMKGSAQSAVPDVVDVAWLAEHVDDSNVVLLHLGGRDDYTAAHIPGARLVAQQDVAAPHDMSAPDHEAQLALELPDPAVARERLQNLGISDDSHVVVYWGTDWMSPSTRVVFTLDWLGLGDRVSLLDGGMPAWTAAGHATTDAPTPAATPGRISARPVRPDVVVDAAWVQAHAGHDGFAVIDARDRVFWDGTEPGNDAGVRGHVPHAVSIPFTSLTNDDGIVRSRDELTRLFRDAAIEEGDVIAVYCHIGQQGTAIVFAARLAGHDVKLYDGSFQDWSRRGLPVELPDAAR